MIEITLVFPQDPESSRNRAFSDMRRLLWSLNDSVQVYAGDGRLLSANPETVRAVAQVVGLAAVSAGPLVAAIKMLPDYVRARRTSVKVAVCEDDRLVEIELDSVNADDAVRAIEQALDAGRKLGDTRLRNEPTPEDADPTLDGRPPSP